MFISPRCVELKVSFIAILIAAVLVASFVPCSEASDGQIVEVVTIGLAAVPVPLPQPTPGYVEPGDYTKLEIIPSYTQFNLKPGESKETMVSVRNRDTKPATLRPGVKSQNYAGPYSLDSSWVTISPQEAEVPAGGSAKFTIRVSAPTDAMRGNYQSMIIFTDEQYPTPYPSAFPNYVHQINLGVNIVFPPAIHISSPYIYDQIEAGKEYRYTIEVKNTGTSTVSLNPKPSSEGYMMYGPSGPLEPSMTESSIAVFGPSSIPPGSTGTVTVIVTVPASAAGSFNGYIDLGIDDLSLREGEGRIMMNFNIWKQPPEPYVKRFVMEKEEPIEIELVASSTMFGGLMSADILRQMPVREPSFDAALTGPEGAVEIRPVKKTITGSVSVGSDPILAGSFGAGTYQETNTRYRQIFAADGGPGIWQLSVMPRNSQSFEYTITLGGADPGTARVPASLNTDCINENTVPEQGISSTPDPVQGNSTS
jgi:hypothetical protein